MMRRTFYTWLLLLACFSWTACTIWESPRKSWEGATGGEQLERQFWKEIAAKNWTELHKHLEPGFSLNTATGALDRDAAIAHWKAIDLQEYSLGDFQVKLAGQDMIVTYSMTRNANPSRESRLMSIWQEGKRGWLLIAHSDAPATEQTQPSQ